MKPAFTLATEAQKQRFLSQLFQTVEIDTTDAKKLLGEGTESSRKLPPAVLSVLRKNVELRRAVAEKFAEDVSKKQGPLTFESAFYQFIASFVSAKLPEDPVKKEYSSILSAIVAPPELPAEAGSQIKKMAAAGHHTTVISIKPEDFTPENIQALEMRAHGVQHTIQMVFDEFYRAATGNLEINERSASYRQFADKMNMFLSPAVQGRA